MLLAALSLGASDSSIAHGRRVNSALVHSGEVVVNLNQDKSLSWMRYWTLGPSPRATPPVIVAIQATRRPLEPTRSGARSHLARPVRLAPHSRRLSLGPRAEGQPQQPRQLLLGRDPLPQVLARRAHVRRRPRPVVLQ